MNYVRMITKKINIIYDVSILDHEHIISIYYRYMIVLFLKTILTVRMFSYILEKIDIKGECIQITQKIENIDRCYIIKNTNHISNDKIITNTLKYLENTNKNIKSIIPINNIILSCSVSTNNNIINVKGYAQKYLNSYTEYNTLRNITVFNNIKINSDDKIKITYFNNGCNTREYDYCDIMDMVIHNFYRTLK